MLAHAMDSVKSPRQPAKTRRANPKTNGQDRAARTGFDKLLLQMKAGRSAFLRGETMNRSHQIARVGGLLCASAAPLRVQQPPAALRPPWPRLAHHKLNLDSVNRT
jgi:hypothetical protein